MGIDLSEFDAAAGRRKPGMPLRVEQILDELDDDRRAALLAALEDPRRFSAFVVATVVTGWGHHLSQGAVRNWRNLQGIR